MAAYGATVPLILVLDFLERYEPHGRELFIIYYLLPPEDTQELPLVKSVLYGGPMTADIFKSKQYQVLDKLYILFHAIINNLAQSTSRIFSPPGNNFPTLHLAPIIQRGNFARKAG